MERHLSLTYTHENQIGDDFQYPLLVEKVSNQLTAKIEVWRFKSIDQNQIPCPLHRLSAGF
jgi:hypothetical protein